MKTLAMKITANCKSALVKILYDLKIFGIKDPVWYCPYYIINRISKLNNLEAMEILVDGGFNVNDVVEFENRETLLMIACKNNNLPIVNFLLAKGADPNKTDALGKSAIFYALHNVEIVKLLHKMGANIEHNSKRDFTPLTFACIHGHYESAEYLLKNKAKISIDDTEDLTLLMKVLKYCPMNTIKIIDLLLKYGENINYINKDGLHPLRVACMFSDNSIVEHLISKGANINTDKTTDLVLICASQYDKTTLVEKLIKLGADVNITDANGANVLITCAKNNCIKTLNLLLKYNQSVDYQSINGETALIWACRFKYVEIIKSLLQFNPNLKLKDNRNKTALDYIANDENIMKLFSQQ